MTTKRNDTVPSTKVIGGPARASYAHVFTPTSMDPDDPKKKYSIALLISKKETALIKEIRAAIKNATEAAKSKWGGKIPANLRNPLRDGDEEKPGDDIYEGHYFINASSPSKPGVIDKDRNPLTSEDEFYSGCYCRFSINFFGYNTAGNKGVGAGLNHLQKIKDGERLGGRASVDEDFAEDWNDDGEASDDDMLG
jgi:hypothetical protein